ELYNIATDPFEANDLKQQNPEAVKQLLTKLDTWKATLPAQPTGAVFSAERSR
ncbi:MAG TPA: N-acetylgalactosamine-6-sulfatase, partial [Opitutae bacterium]|nr:N-acetylgalactosamine-6-sulfatase [Opitutae bacterium]